MRKLETVKQMLVKFWRTPVLLGWSVSGYAILFCTTIYAISLDSDQDSKINTVQNEQLYLQALNTYGVELSNYNLCLQGIQDVLRDDTLWNGFYDYVEGRTDPENLPAIGDLRGIVRETTEKDLAKFDCISPTPPERLD